MKNKMAGCAAAAGMLILILDSKTALIGAVQGIDLCLKTVIPSLFPFILLSNLLISVFYGVKLPLFSKLGSLFHLPEAVSYLLVPAFLGGYPVGAQCVNRLYTSGKIDRSSAERMLAFCSNVGPSFLFGILIFKFQSVTTLWKLWSIQIMSAFTAAQFFHAPIQTMQGCTASKKDPQGIMESTVKILAKICGWIVLFRILIAFLERWFLWILPTTCKIVLIGILELSNGCCILEQITNEAVRFVAASGILAFGGICVLYQTAAVCTHLHIRYYLAGKCLQMICAVLYAGILQSKLWHLLPIWLVITYYLSIQRKKKSSFPIWVVV